MVKKKFKPLFDQVFKIVVFSVQKTLIDKKKIKLNNFYFSEIR